LRLLQEQEFERVGGTRTYRVDTRLIAATHRNLEERVKNGEFRDDLYYRLNVFPIRLPALRERREDIPLLARYFVDRISARYGRVPGEFSDSAVERLCDYSWPGNVRELENVIERALILSEGGTIEERNLLLGDDSRGNHVGPVSTLRDMERRHILTTLESTAWKISGKGGAAELLGLRPTTLESRMARLGLVRDRRRS
jgi:transcriptional regulator with GAF, ATPase, and Fis domain